LIFVIGSGLLGSEVIKAFRAGGYEVTGTYNSKPKDGAVRVDISDRVSVAGAIKTLEPEAVIHTAALTNVDYCEDHRQESMEVNATGTRNVAEACRYSGAKLVYVSTDFVFNGEKGMYREDDPVDPLSVYAYTKLLGEYYTRGLEDSVIARTSVVYGNERQNFVSWVRDSLKAGTKIKVVTDQFNSPTFSTDCAEALLALIKENASGTFHTAGSERLSRYEFARKIADHYGADASLIEPVDSTAFKQKAKRPMDSSLDVSKVSKYHKMLDIIDGLKRMDSEGI
jgi:dTDP-4-dehydrorhamnose reductase